MDWVPTQFFRADSAPTSPYAILVLNQPINEIAFDAIRSHASYILCADGGANRYYELMKSRGRENIDLPSAILGDLDSLLPSVRQHYAAHNVPILFDDDQDTADFTKCLKFLRAHAGAIARGEQPPPHRVAAPGRDLYTPSKESLSSDSSALDVLAMGGLGGRVDQAFSQIHHLYYFLNEPSSSSGNRINLFLISEESISFVLPPGDHTIRTPHTCRSDLHRNPTSEERHRFLLAENVGIIPLHGRTALTLRGFEWDVTDWESEIGGQLSTSNHIRADSVYVSSLQSPVLFTVELAERFKKGRPH